MYTNIWVILVNFEINPNILSKLPEMELLAILLLGFGGYFEAGVWFGCELWIFVIWGSYFNVDGAHDIKYTPQYKRKYEYIWDKEVYSVFCGQVSYINWNSVRL